ncbi:MAG TPA: alpha-D-ribose 1-methylphosphonate 5-triphosphate diphosphatase [Hyphomicrobiaceae bacterium]|nr:alpha-D-ribose 1-methylphosphonate 5-triphosphate diphosphatase [Hyphomicrobiaceae bacterium]
MTRELVIGNARVVLADSIVEGWVAARDGLIVEVGRGPAPRGSLDAEGDLVIPGLIELHTDHLETHLRPRPKVHWPERSAILSFDAQIAASGITTVFDCIRAGRDDDYSPIVNEISIVIDGIRRAAAGDLLRAEHLVHLRCEVTADDVLDDAMKAMDQRVDLISLMDHTPGARQFTNLEAWRTYYGGKSGRSQADLDKLIDIKHASHARNYDRHRRTLVSLARERGIVLASHDDATRAHVDESIADKVAIAEFPTTAEAARLSHEAGIDVLMGAPNVVRGGSHSGNVAAEALARAGHLDILSSDYVPASLLLGAFELARRIEGYGLARALRTVTLNPARAANLTDRGEIAEGKRADLVRVHVVEGQPVVRNVYREGRRVS